MLPDRAFNPYKQKDPGRCLVSKAILNGSGKVKWCFRQRSLFKKVDNGWRFLADTDTDETTADPNNLTACDFMTLAGIEPAVLAIYNMPVGTDLALEREDGKLVFYDTKTGYPIE